VLALFRRSPLPSPRQAQAFLRAVAAPGRTVVRSGPFELFLHPSDPFEFLNYAIPTNGARPSPRQIDALRARFRERGRVPRLEFLEDVAPAVGVALEQAGMRTDLRAPLMACRADGLVVPELPGVEVGPPDDLRAMLDLQRVAFGQLPLGASDPVPPPSAGGAVVAKVDGVLAAVAEFSRVVDGVSEVVGVATARSYRRRGLAGLVTAEVGKAAARAGARVLVLSPGSDGAERVYARAGFVRIATIRHVSAP
jgi:GNAT superfamily N-acetyltransferase